MQGKLQLPFTKMTGTGNDFIIFDNRKGHFTGQEKDFFARICHRRLSVGADGVLLLESGRDSLYYMRYLNSDGREAPMCGNGLRCLAYYTYYKGITGNSEFSMEASDGVHDIKIQDKLVSIGMATTGGFEIETGILLDANYIEGGFVDTGVPHFVLFTQDLASVDVEKEAPYYRSHTHFKNGVNVNFVQVLDGNRLGVRTYERGVEKETLSCGTGCVASALIAFKKYNIESPILTVTQGGELTIAFDHAMHDVTLTAEVDLIYEGWLARDVSPE